MVGGNLRGQRRLPQPGREPGEIGRPDTDLHLGESLRVTRFQRHGPGDVAGLERHQAHEQQRRLLVGLVLQQPGKEQVTGLQQGEVLHLVIGDRPRQQAGRLEVEQGRGDHQELGGLPEVETGAEAADVRHELVGDLGERDLGDVQLVFGDQGQQQIERPAEVGELDHEGAAGPAAAGRHRHCGRSSLGCRGPGHSSLRARAGLRCRGGVARRLPGRSGARRGIPGRGGTGCRRGHARPRRCPGPCHDTTLPPRRHEPSRATARPFERGRPPAGRGQAGPAVPSAGCGSRPSSGHGWVRSSGPAGRPGGPSRRADPRQALNRRRRRRCCPAPAAAAG